MEKIAQREELGGDKTKLELSKRAQQLLDRRGRFLPLPRLAAAKGKTSAGGQRGAELFFREIFTGKSVRETRTLILSIVDDSYCAVSHNQEDSHYFE